MMAIVDYLMKYSDTSTLSTFQIWDASEIDKVSLSRLLYTLASFKSLSVLQLITDSGLSPLHSSMSVCLPDLIRALPMLEDVILNSQEEGSAECAVKVLEALSLHTKVRVLDISINSKADDMLPTLGAFIAQNQCLERLYLWGNCFVGDGFKYLVEPISSHTKLDRLHLELVPSRLSLRNCQYLAQIIEQNKSLSELDGVDYNEEEKIDLHQAVLLLKACDKNLCLSRIDFFAMPNQYPFLNTVSTYFSCVHSEGYFVRALCFSGGLLHDYAADLVHVSRLVPLLDHVLPREVADLVISVSVPSLLARESQMLISVLRCRSHLGQIQIGNTSSSFSYQALIRACSRYIYVFG